ncbi:MAG: PDZ domain-containing protein, partial [Planctomycetia bacterium]
YRRGTTEAETAVALVDALPVYIPPWIGATIDRERVVRRLVDGAPALTAGLKIGDVIDAVDGSPVDRWAALVERYFDRAASEAVELTVVRDGEKKSVVVKTAAVPVELPNMPPRPSVKETGAKNKTGVVEKNLLDGVKVRVYIPDDYDDAVPHGLALSFGGEATKFGGVSEVWRKVCADRDVLLCRATPPKKQGLVGKHVIDAAVAALKKDYSIDDARVYVVSDATAYGAAAGYVAERRAMIRGWLAVQPERLPAPALEPAERLWSLVVVRETPMEARRKLEALVAEGRRVGQPIVAVLSGATDPLEDPRVVEMVSRWLEASAGL